MADVTRKQNDTYPPLLAQLTDTVGPINLTTATTVELIMVEMGSGSATGGGFCAITDAVAGRVSYEWDPEDTDDVGIFNAEFEIVWADGGIQTVPNTTYFTVEIKDDLG
jgi:hypothetical protein